MSKPELASRLWTATEVADRWGLSPKTLRNWRSRGVGPAYLKVGNRALYTESALARWEADRQRASA